MLKPLNVHNKCNHCIRIADFEDENYFRDTMGWGCDFFNEGVSILGDTPCDLDDYNKCPNKVKDERK